MAITSIRIHPAIGVARVGNSPDEFFIGPERTWERPDPPGGFKDAQCRVKRQAARFRIFAHHDDGTWSSEITDAEADITWTVHLANTQGGHPRSRQQRAADDLTIDPGPRTLTGPNQRAAVRHRRDQLLRPVPPATVPLGEMRTDDEGHLLVLGGFGHSASPTGADITDFWDNDGWYDDVSDGPVTAPS